MTRKTETVAHLDTSIKRWKTRLRRAMNMLGKLEKKRARLVLKTAEAAVLSEPKVPASTLVAAVKGHIKRTTKPEPLAVTIMRELAAPDPTPVLTVDKDAHLDIPGFLRRAKEETENDFLQAAADLVKQDPDLKKAFSDKAAADQLREEQATVKKAKAAGRIAKLKAKKAGELKKMPLSGKAALDAIRNG